MGPGASSAEGSVRCLSGSPRDRLALFIDDGYRQATGAYQSLIVVSNVYIPDLDTTANPDWRGSPGDVSAALDRAQVIRVDLDANTGLQ